MKYLAVNLNVEGRPCLVVGGGEVGRRKSETLLEAGAEVLVVSRELCVRLQELVDQGRVKWLSREFEPGRLDGAALAYAATDDPKLNARVVAEARRRGVFVNAADRPEESTFIVPATVRRGDLLIGVSTGGRSPALAARVRARLEDIFGPEYEILLDILGRVREKVLSRGRPAEENRELFRKLVESNLLDLLAAGDRAGAEEAMIEILGPGFSLTELGVDLERGRP